MNDDEAGIMQEKVKSWETLTKHRDDLARSLEALDGFELDDTVRGIIFRMKKQEGAELYCLNLPAQRVLYSLRVIIIEEIVNAEQSIQDL